MYTLETLREENEFFGLHHTLTQTDVDTANVYKLAIERSRSRLSRPEVGDVLMINGKPAHIEQVENGEVSICENPYLPFIRCRFMDSNASITTSTSGGPWKSISLDRVEKTKETTRKRFTFFGSCGMRAHGAVEFTAVVNVFNLKS